MREGLLCAIAMVEMRVVTKISSGVKAVVAALIGIALIGIGGRAQADGAPPMTVGGHFEVNSSGAATYSIPILVPPGTAGMAPALSLNYSSQSGNGIVGFGWSLGGLPSITRCPRTYAQDGVHGSVNYDAYDRFCLDGQRLLVTQGSYGADLSQYRTEIESFSKIIAHTSGSAGPDWFEVHTKSGQILELGNTTDSRIIPVMVPGVPQTSSARVWAVDKISDTVGNYLKVIYHDGADGQYYPDHIVYSLNDTASLTAYNSVWFEYAARPDPNSLYHAGAVMPATMLLTDIRTYLGSTTSENGTLVTDYHLDYLTENAAFSHLTSIKRCPTTGPTGCLPATTFTWQTTGSWPARIFIDSTPSLVHSIGWHGQWLAADFNGDGIQDGVLDREANQTNYCEPNFNALPVAFGTGSGLVPSNALISGTSNLACLYIPSTNIVQTYVPGQVGDYEGDGLADIENFLELLKYNGSGNFDNVTSTGGFGFLGGDPFVPQAFDLNDDGISDNAGWDGGSGTLSISTNDVSHNQTNYSFSIGSSHVSIGTGLGGDVDGDGCPDFAFQRAVHEIFLTCQSLAAGAPRTIYMDNYYTDDSHFSTIYWGDFNGDGKSDYFTVPYPTGSGILKISTGASFLPAASQYDFQYGTHQNNYLIGDFDGDGKSDVILIATTNFSVYTWDGNAGKLVNSLTVNDVLPQPGCGIGTTCTDPSWNGRVMVSDVDGDGCSDLVVYQGTHSPTDSYYYKFGCHPPLLMTSIANGLGATTAITYDRLNKNDFYTKCTGLTGVYRCPTTSYPTQSVDGPIYVVKSVASSNGNGGNFTSDYAYRGAKKDLLGRNFLGFEQVAVTNEQTNVTRTTSYNMLFPYTGTITEQKMTVAGDNGTIVLNDTINSYGTVPAVPVMGTPTFVYLKDTTVSTNEVDGSALPTRYTTHMKPDGTLGYDAYGNPTYIKTWVPDGSSKETTNGYWNDATNWILGRLTSTQVVSTVTGSTITRTSSFTYTPTGLLSKEFIEPNSTGGCNGNNTSCTLETDYLLFDPYGHWTKKKMIGYGFANRVSYVGYDAKGQFMISDKNALGQQELFDYSGQYGTSFGVVTRHTDLNGIDTTFQYDEFGRLKNQTRSGLGGQQTDVAYALCTPSICPTNGAFMVTTTPYSHNHGAINGPQSITYYDMLSRVVVTDVQGYDGPQSGCSTPCWIRTVTDYNRAGYVADVSRPYFLAGGTPMLTTYGYTVPVSGQTDPFGRAWKITFPDQSVTKNAYTGLGSAGSQTAVTNDLLQTTTTKRNAQGLVSSVVNALSANNTTSYTYDAYGDLKDVADPLGNHITATYDIRGNKLTSADPDLGNWSYTYDALGELLSQTDAKSQLTSMVYDALGRVTSRTEADQTSTWTYDTSTNGVGLIHSATGTNANYSRTYFYDPQARPSSVVLSVSGTAYTYTPSFENTNGRLDTLTYPSGLKVQYVYTTLGYLQQLQDSATGAVLWTANKRDAEMHLTDQSAGNHVRSIAFFDPNTGLVSQIRAGANENDDSSVAHFDYTFDTIGNLLNRSDTFENYAENFCYDSLNRLQNYSVGALTNTNCHTGNAGLVKTASYDAIGNLTSKSDLAGTETGNFTYPTPGGGTGSRPHAVTAIAGTVNGIADPNYTYDSNGNLVCEYTGTGCLAGGIIRETDQYWASNMTKTITQGTTHVAYVYDSEHQRVTQTVTTGSSAVTKTYLNDPITGAMSEVVVSGGTPTWTDYLMADGKLMGQRSCTGATPCSTGATSEYFVLDHLQSVAVVTDGTTGSGTYGQVTARESFDAWGRQRNADGTDNATCSNGASSPNKRRFTSQEHIDEMCLINLNARVYDPTIGRFMTADSIVPDPTDGQTYNRYTYVSNRPLSFTDPTGHDSNVPWCLGSCTNPNMTSTDQFSVQSTYLDGVLLSVEIVPNSDGAAAAAFDKSADGSRGVSGGPASGIGSSGDGASNGDVKQSQEDGKAPNSVNSYLHVRIAEEEKSEAEEKYEELKREKDEEDLQEWKNGTRVNPPPQQKDLDYPDDGSRGPVIDPNELTDRALGCIYCVSGAKTQSGDDYIGRSDNMEIRENYSRDGRDRRGAEIVGTYPRGDRDAARAAEQREINARGGVGNLDNKRNEIAPKNWQKFDIPIN